MIIRKYTKGGKWGKPMLQTSCMERLGGTLHSVTNERVNCTMVGDGFIVQIGRGEYELLKYWFENEDKKLGLK